MKIRSTLLIAIIASVLNACQSGKTDDTAAQETADVEANDPAMNQLTAEQKAEGWVQLFDGSSLNGFRFYQNKENNSWEVADGALHAKPDTTGAEKRADLLTSGQYENFELMFDWKVPAGGNSGVMYRVTEAFDAPYLSGPEYQIIDDKGWPGDPLKDTQLTGSNYDMHAAPAEKPLNGQGEWNTSKIVVNGNHVEHWLNGAKLLEYELNGADWKKRRDSSKWKDAEGYGQSTKGYIAFQDHGQEIWFRNVYVKPL